MRFRQVGAKLHRWLFRQGWLSGLVESEPVVGRLKSAVRDCWRHQDRPFFLEAGDDEERGRQFRLPQLLEWRGVLYGVAALLGMIVFLLLTRAGGFQPDDFRFFGVVPSFVGSVVAIGLPLVTAFGTLRKAGRWAEEYIFRATHLGWFTFMSCLTASVGLVSILTAPLYGLNAWSAFSTPALAGLAWGLAMATLLYLTAVVLEIIHCSGRPAFICAAAAETLAQRLLEGFLRNAYIAMFMRFHEDYLEQACADLEHVAGPRDFTAMRLRYGKGDERDTREGLQVKSPKFHIQEQFLDYYLPALGRINELVGRAGSRLHLNAHNSSLETAGGHVAVIGTLVPRPAQKVHVSPKWFRPRPDFCALWDTGSQEDVRNIFLSEMSRRLSEFDTRGYRLHLNAVRRAVGAFAKVWADAEVREEFRPGREQEGHQRKAGSMPFEEVQDWIWVYVRLLNQILHHRPEVDRTPYAETLDFVSCHQRAYGDLLRDSIETGRAETFGLLLRLLPEFHRRVGEFCEAQGDGQGIAKETLKELKETRAKWGGVFEMPSVFLDALPADIDAPTRWRFLLFAHRFASVWIRQAQGAHDGPLVDNIAEAIARVMELDHEWRELYKAPPESDVLMTRHWLILGESLQETLATGRTTPAKPTRKLIPAFLKEQEPADILSFYASHTRVDEHDPDFRDLRPDLEIAMPPLGGPGFGPVRTVPYHTEEMRLAFLSLLLMGPERTAPPTSLPVDVLTDALRKDLEKLVELAEDNEVLWRPGQGAPEGAKHWIEQWLEECANEKVAQSRQAVAEAPIDPEKARQFSQEFGENFGQALVLTRFLVDVGAYEVVKELEPFPVKTLVQKMTVIGPPLGVNQTVGDRFGRYWAHALDTGFVNTLLGPESEEPTCSGDYRSAIPEAVAWLDKRGCTGNKGLVCVLGPAYLPSLFMESSDFVPAWKEAVGVDGFEGRYKGLPVWQGQFDRKRRVIAVDLRDIRPLRVRPECLTATWADAVIRELRDEELNEISEARKRHAKPFDELEERLNCVADISVYARFTKPDKANVMVFGVEQEEQPASDLPAEGDEPAD